MSKFRSLDYNTTPKDVWRADLQVFGKGHSQQQDCVAVLHGKPSIVLFSWWDPSDYTVVIQVSIGDDGYPTHAWIDGSCT